MKLASLLTILGLGVQLTISLIGSALYKVLDSNVWIVFSIIALNLSILFMQFLAWQMDKQINTENWNITQREDVSVIVTPHELLIYSGGTLVGTIVRTDQVLVTNTHFLFGPFAVRKDKAYSGTYEDAPTRLPSGNMERFKA